LSPVDQQGWDGKARITMSKLNKTISKQSEEEAYKLALGIQRPGQSKEQTKLIAQGISKGIDLYKKQQKAKAREQDKNRKKSLKNREQWQDSSSGDEQDANHSLLATKLPWILLGLSWLGFIVYLVLQR
jgi:Protein of unknown function (DUF2956)